MRWTTASLATLALLVAGPAFAQSTTPSPSSPSATTDSSSPSATSGATSGTQAGSGAAGSGTAMTQQKLRKAMEQAGFQDIQVLDTAFLVQARTQDGETVMMVVNPPATAAGSSSSGMTSGGTSGGSSSGGSTSGGMPNKGSSQ